MAADPPARRYSCRGGVVTARKRTLMPAPTSRETCQACGSHGRPIRLTAGDESWRPRGCPRCGLRWLASPPTGEALLELYRSGFYEQRAPRASAIVMTLHRLNSRLRLMTLREQRPGRMLDIGCGKGHFLAAAREAGWDVRGVDLSAEAVDYARRTYGLDVRVGDVADLDLDERFDAVTLWHVLEHVADPGDLIERSRSLLGPGGRLVISVPNAASLQARLAGVHWLHLDIPRHVFHFDLRSIDALLVGRGFAIERHDTFYPEMELAGLVQSVLNAAGGERDLIYRFLKQDPTVALNGRVATALVAAGLLIPGAAAWSLVAPLLDTGASLQVVARPV